MVTSSKRKFVTKQCNQTVLLSSFERRFVTKRLWLPVSKESLKPHSFDYQKFWLPVKKIKIIIIQFWLPVMEECWQPNSFANQFWKKVCNQTVLGTILLALLTEESPTVWNNISYDTNTIFELTIPLHKVQYHQYQQFVTADIFQARRKLYSSGLKWDWQES